ncbi:MAG: hypothetical protein K1X74_04750 [Pirellulales bacterium]|nr:hypothetical protein [Pirellulales bacterium]
MYRTLSRVALGLFLAVLVHLATRSHVQFPLEPGQVYAVATLSNTAEFDLPFADGDTQYLLVATNQAAECTGRHFELAAEPVAAAQIAPLRKIAPLARQQLVATIPAMPQVKQPAPAPEQRVFWLEVAGEPQAASARRQQVVTRLAGEGAHVRIWLDVNDQVDSAWVREVINGFESQVRPTAARYVGLPADVDGDGCFGIVVTSWLHRLAGGRIALGGMVQSDDYDASATETDANRADVLYLSAELARGPHLQTVLAHEFAHAVCGSGRLEHQSLLFSSRHEESWLNEAIAHVVENLHSDNWSNLDHRVSQFLAQPESTPLVVPDYQAAGLFRAAAPRGSTYLFLRWCVEQYGPGLLPKLIYSGRSGVANLEAATGEPFSELYRRYAADLFLQALTADGKQATGVLPRVDLGGELGTRGLAGPRFEFWDLAAGESLHRAAQVTGTGSKYFVVTAPEKGVRRLRITAERGASLQVSVVRLRDPLPRLSLAARMTPDGECQLELRENGGHRLRVDRVAWEPLSGTVNAQPGPQTTCLHRAALAQCFGTTTLAPGEVLTGVPGDLARAPRGPLAVNVVGYDDDGRRITSWATLDLGAAGIRVASAPDDTRRK